MFVQDERTEMSELQRKQSKKAKFPVEICIFIIIIIIIIQNYCVKDNFTILYYITKIFESILNHVNESLT